MPQCRALLGVQNFLFRGAVYPKDIWHGDATYPRIFCTGVPKTGGDEYPMTPAPYCACVKVMIMGYSVGGWVGGPRVFDLRHSFVEDTRCKCSARMPNHCPDAQPDDPLFKGVGVDGVMIMR